MTITPDSLYFASIMNAEGTDTERVDVRTLNAKRLESLCDEAASVGDHKLAAVISMVQADEEPSELPATIDGQLEQIAELMGSDATAEDAAAMRALLVRFNCLVSAGDGSYWVCCTGEIWDDFVSEAVNIVANR